MHIYTQFVKNLAINGITVCQGSSVEKSLSDFDCFIPKNLMIISKS